MSDSSDYEVDAGFSGITPTQCSALRKGGYVVLKDAQCKIMEITYAKTGKHGVSKASITGINLFTGKKVEASISSSHMVGVPDVIRAEYQLMGIESDGFLSLMDEKSQIRHDLKLPRDEELAEKMESGFEDGKKLYVTVLSACGKGTVISVREKNS